MAWFIQAVVAFGFLRNGRLVRLNGIGTFTPTVGIDGTKRIRYRGGAMRRPAGGEGPSGRCEQKNRTAKRRAVRGRATLPH